MMKEDVVYEKSWYRNTALVMINRPEQHNSYVLDTLRRLINAFDDAMSDETVHFIVLTGAGDRAFCTGGNVHEYNEVYGSKPIKWFSYGEIYGRFLDMIMHCGKPVIARINGTVAGGGLEFAAAADLAIAAEHARFLSPGPRVGMTSVGGISQWLPLHIGIKRTNELVMLSRELTAKEALEWGIVNDVCPLHELDNRVRSWIDKMSELSYTSLQYFKVQINWWKDIVWRTTWENAKMFFTLNAGSVEPYEGMKAFREKRKPGEAQSRIRSKIAAGMDPRYPHGPYAKSCPSCGAEHLPANSKYCLACGSPLTGG